MLLRFYIDNFLSFGDETFFDMLPGKNLKTNLKNHIFSDNSVLKKEKRGSPVCVLPFAAIYGANASGKSNLIEAFRFVKVFVLGRNSKDKEEIPIEPFLLSEKNVNEPTQFEMVFKTEGVVYTYGFRVGKERVWGEWLYRINEKSENELVFERVFEGGKQKFTFGVTLDNLDSSKPEAWISSRELFLTFACNAEEKKEAFLPIYHWFERWTFFDKNRYFNFIPAKVYEDNDFRKFLSQMVNSIDTGISSIQSQRQKMTKEEYQQLPLSERLGALMFFRAENKDIFTYKLLLEHYNDNGKTVHFPVEMESDGTRRMLELLPILYLMNKEKDQYNLFIIDELDNGIHPLLSSWFLNAFIANPYRRGSQMIFTTHDINLLDEKLLLRQDEIWFVEKNSLGKSHFTRLSEYEDSDKIKYKNGYLNGRFGGIPNLKRLEEAFPHE